MSVVVIAPPHQRSIGASAACRFDATDPNPAGGLGRWSCLRLLVLEHESFGCRDHAHDPARDRPAGDRPQLLDERIRAFDLEPPERR
jgi:hypothetical protein